MAVLAPTTEQLWAAWDAIAPGFDRFVVPESMQLGERLLDRVDLRPGTRLLEVAAGSGDRDVGDALLVGRPPLERRDVEQPDQRSADRRPHARPVERRPTRARRDAPRALRRRARSRPRRRDSHRHRHGPTPPSLTDCLAVARSTNERAGFLPAMYVETWAERWPVKEVFDVQAS